MSLQEALLNSNLDEVLEGLPGDYEKIRQLRDKLNTPERELFDIVFLLGFREGILLKFPNEGDPMCKVNNEQSKKYVRLAPTTLHLAPDCYGNFDEEYTMDSDCPLCAVHNQCKDGVKLESK